jgi:hypothetical protein
MEKGGPDGAPHRPGLEAIQKSRNLGRQQLRKASFILYHNVNACTNLFWNKTKPDEVRKIPGGRGGWRISIINPGPLMPL